MKDIVVIGISGGAASGKTTLAKKIKKYFNDDVLLLCQDYYYRCLDDLTMEERKKVNFDHPSAFDNDLLIEHIELLKKGQPIQRPVYSFVEYTRLNETITEQSKKVIIVEGILLFENKRLRDLMDIKIFVETDSDIRLIRRIRRDMAERGRDLDSVIAQYLNTVKPSHEDFIEPSKKYADVIVPEGGLNEVALSMLIDKITSILHK